MDTPSGAPTKSDELRDLIPLAKTFGIEIDYVGKDQVRAHMPWRADLCTTMDVLHGGALMAFADTVGAVCASQHLPEGAITTTIESKTNFFRPVTSGDVHSTTTPLHTGRRTIVVQTNLTKDDGKLVAQVTQTQAVISNG